MLDRELKKGSAELIILSIVESRAPAWLRDQPADRDALGRAAEVPHRLAVSPALSPRGARLAAGALGREGRTAAAAVLPAHRRGPARARQPAQHLEGLRRRHAAHHRSRSCVNHPLERRRPARIRRRLEPPPAPAPGVAAAQRGARGGDRRGAVAAPRRSLRAAARRRHAPTQTRSDSRSRSSTARTRWPRRMRALRQAHMPPPLPEATGGPRARHRTPSRSALRRADAAQAAGIRARRRADAGARHRRQHRGVQPGQRHALPAPAGARPRAPRLREPGTPAGSSPIRNTNRCATMRRRSRRWRAGAASSRASTPASRRSSSAASSSPATSSTCSASRRRADGCSPAADDQTPGAHPVAVISYDFWQTRFGGQPDVDRPRDPPQRARLHHRRRHSRRIPRTAVSAARARCTCR